MSKRSVDEVIVRAVTTDDAGGFFRLCDGERQRIHNYFPVTTERTVDERAAAGYVRELIDQAQRREAYCFLVWLPGDPDPVGAVFLKSFDWRIPKCEMAYFVAAKHQGKGIGSAAVAWAADEALRRLGMERVFLRIDPQNTASIRVGEKNGFAKEGLLKRDFRTTDGALLDVLVLARIKDR
jgi:ribosomal-protein-serine acetyltransferase